MKARREPTVQVSEEESANWFSLLLFTWVSPLMSRGWTKYREGALLLVGDLLRLPEDETARSAHGNFARRAQHAKQNDPEKDISILMVLVTMCRRDLLIGAVYRLLQDAGMIGAPFLMRELILWFVAMTTNPSGTKSYVGYLWSTAISAKQFLICLFQNEPIPRLDLHECIAVSHQQGVCTDAVGGMYGRIRQPRLHMDGPVRLASCCRRYLFQSTETLRRVPTQQQNMI